VRKPEGKGPLRRPSVDGRIILRRIFRKWDVGVLTVCIVLAQDTDSNEPSGFIKCREFLD
jgi:hypothetical protein